MPRILAAAAVGAALFVVGLLGAIVLADDELARWSCLAVQVLGGVVLIAALVAAARRT